MKRSGHIPVPLLCTEELLVAGLSYINRLKETWQSAPCTGTTRYKFHNEASLPEIHASIMH